MGRLIVFLGKVGHGKTRLLNVLTKSDYASSAAASSCTRGLQLARIPGSNVTVIDTPGFYSSEDTQGHLKAQVEAFAEPVNGVYIIVRFGAASEMAEVANRMMDFTGEEDVRVICTHVDTIEREQGFNEAEVAMELSSLLEIPSENIAMVGKDTKSKEIQDFLWRTVHRGRKVSVADEQRSVAASLAVGARRFNQEIDGLGGILAEASQTLAKTDELSHGPLKSFVTELLVRKAKDNFEGACKDITTKAKELLPAEQDIVVTKVHDATEGKLNSFLAKHKQSTKAGGKPYRYQSTHSRGSHKSYGPSGYPRDYGHGRSKFTGRNDIHASDQPQNQADKDLEAALYSFLVSYHNEAINKRETDLLEGGEAWKHGGDMERADHHHHEAINKREASALALEGGEASKRGVDMEQVGGSWNTGSTSRELTDTFSSPGCEAKVRGGTRNSWCEVAASTAFPGGRKDREVMKPSTDDVSSQKRRYCCTESKFTSAATMVKLSSKPSLTQAESAANCQSTISYQKADDTAWRVEYQHPLAAYIDTDGDGCVDCLSSMSFEDNGQWCYFSTGHFG